MNRHLPILFILVAIGAGYAHANQFGSDHRVALSVDERSSYPYRCVGKVVPPGCTATLIGACQILTAKHCAAAGSVFYPAYDYGPSPFGRSSVIRWHYSKDGADWAIGDLAEDLGSTVRWIRVQPLSTRERDISYRWVFSLIGYSGDRYGGERATIHRGCYVRAKDGVTLIHCCDTTRGSSGAPLIAINGEGEWLIVGLNTAEDREGDESQHGADCDRNPNYAIASNAFFAAAMQLTRNSSARIQVQGTPEFAFVREQDIYVGGLYLGRCRMYRCPYCYMIGNFGTLDVVRRYCGRAIRCPSSSCGRYCVLPCP